MLAGLLDGTVHCSGRGKEIIVNTGRSRSFIRVCIRSFKGNVSPHCRRDVFSHCFQIPNAGIRNDNLKLSVSGSFIRTRNNALAIRDRLNGKDHFIVQLGTWHFLFFTMLLQERTYLFLRGYAGVEDVKGVRRVNSFLSVFLNILR